MKACLLHAKTSPQPRLKPWLTNSPRLLHLPVDLSKKREYWGLRALAYRIKKNRKGHYIMFNMETGPEALSEYERILGLNEDVLRFLNIRIDEVPEGPSIMMQAKPSGHSAADEMIMTIMMAQTGTRILIPTLKTPLTKKVRVNR